MAKLTRRQTLGALGALGGGLAVSTFPQPLLAATPKKQYHLAPKNVADGVWMIEGATEYFTDENGGAIVNCTLIETSAGLLIIDTGPSLRYGTALRAITSQLGGFGVAGIINTHHHPDHFFGNQVFTERPIHALAGTKKLAEAEGEAFADNMYRLLGDWMRGTESTPPNTELTSSFLNVGDREFQIYPLKGHTGADLAILDKKTGTLITGDLAFLNRAPTTPHANIADWRAALKDLKSISATGIIPGHGSFDVTGASLDQTSDYLTWLDTSLRRSAVQGLSMVEILDTPMPERFAGMGAMPQEFNRSISHLYPGIERETLPLVTK